MTNPTKALTDKQVAALKPRAEAYRVSDGAGLFLMVMPTGLKVWRCVYACDGQRHRHKLGEYPAMSLARARLARQRVRVTVQDGGHPTGERATAKQERRARDADTLDVMARKWHAKNAAHRWSPSYARQLLQRLERHAFTDIGAMPITAITPPDIKRLLERCIDRTRSKFQADHVRQHLVCAFNDFIDDGLLALNPAARFVKLTAPDDTKPQPAVLTIEAAREVLAKVEASDSSVSMKLFHRFLALTGLRPSEVREARWPEFHGDTWRIPGERMKGRRGRKKGHTCFLSPAALEVIEVARARAPAGAVFVFPTENYGHARHEPFGRSSLCELMTRVLGRRVHVAHGWRATMATVLRTRHPEAKDLVQVMLAHQTKEAVARLYDRTDEMMFEPKLRPLACEWADLLLEGAPSAWSVAGLPAPGSNVVQLDDVRRAA